MLCLFVCLLLFCFFFFSSRRRHTRWSGDWSSDVCSSDLDIINITLRSPLQKVTKRIYRELSRRFRALLIRQYDRWEIIREAFLKGIGYNIQWKAPAHHAPNWSVCYRWRQISLCFIITGFRILLLDIRPLSFPKATREKFCRLFITVLYQTLRISYFVVTLNYLKLSDVYLFAQDLNHVISFELCKHFTRALKILALITLPDLMRFIS